MSVTNFVYEQGPTDWVFYDDFNDLNISATSGAAKWTLLETAAGATELLSLTETGGVLELTQAANDNDVISLIANSGFKLSDLKVGSPVRFGARFKVTDADDCDIHVGLSIHDTSIVASAPADYIAFRLADGDAGLDLVISKDSALTIVDDFCDMADATYARVFFEYFPGLVTDIGRLDYVVHTNGVTRRGSVDANGNFPDDVVIFPTIQFQNGAAAADVANVDWIYAKAERAAYVNGTG
jgi:hypothetical protein